MTNFQRKGIYYFKNRISEMEENIANKRKDNYDMSVQLKKLKTKQNVKGKELQTNNIMKKYPNQINSLTDEIKNIMGKKQEYLTKISNNKKSLKNLRSILSNVEKNYNNIVSSKSFPKTVDNLTQIRIIEDTIQNFKKDLELPEEELIDKINKHETFNKFSLSNRMLSSPKITRKKVLGIESMSVAKKNLYAKLNIRSNNSVIKNKKETDQSQEKNTSKFLLPKILNNNNQYEAAKRSLSPYKGIFNKYEYLNKKDKTKSINISNGNKKVYGINIRTNNLKNNRKDEDRSNDDMLENSDEGMDN
jgi:hypothetical protein